MILRENGTFRSGCPKVKVLDISIILVGDYDQNISCDETLQQECAKALVIQLTVAWRCQTLDQQHCLRMSI